MNIYIVTYSDIPAEAITLATLHDMEAGNDLSSDEHMAYMSAGSVSAVIAMYEFVFERSWALRPPGIEISGYILVKAGA